ncbi:NHL repeat-containing protein [Sphingomonas sp. RS6]
MTVNLSANLVGLSVLTGSNAFTSFAPITYESKAVRTAKAQFTLAETTPPWKEETSAATASSLQLSSILTTKTIIDKSGSATGEILPDDVQTTFVAYKALEKLRVLAEAATVKTASDAQRATYEKAFAKGLADLQNYLVTSPSDKVNLAFGKPTSTAKSNELASSALYEVSGKPLVTKRSDPLTGLTGTEVFSAKLTRPGLTESFTIDLADGPQPPTIDSVANALNEKISSTLIYKADGTPQLDSKGNPVSRWLIRFVPEYADGKWGLKVESPDGIEQIALDQVGAGDSLVVATGQTALDAPSATQVFRLNDPAGDSTKVSMGTIQALDRDATAQNTLAGKTTTVTTTSTDMDGKVTTNTTKTSNVYANTDASAIVTDAQGYSYVVGTTKGDLGANLSDGDDNLFLTKMDGAGNVVWQRNLGASGSATGASVSIAPDGGVVVAGTVTGSFNGVTSDGDMVVAKYAANGDEQFSTVVRSTGIDTAKAVAVGADGSVYVGGKTATAGGDAFVARIDPSGKLAERRTISTAGSDVVNGLAVDGDGNLLALVSRDGNAEVMKLQGDSLATDLGSFSLGKADARVIAVAEDGTIGVGGATSAAISGGQANGLSGGRDGFVTRIDAGLSGASTTYIGSAADDQVDSIAFMGSDLYAGGRTTGDLAATRRGPTDGFVTRIDTATGAIESTNQFGQALLRTEPVRVAADKGGANALSALGFGRGVVNAVASDKVTTQTTLRPGDYFSIKADNGAVRKVIIEKDDTLKTIATRIQGMIGASKGTVTATSVDGVQSLRITMKAGHELELLAGGADTDALSKLGIEPQRIANQATVSSSAPKVRPGGNFGLDLSEALSLATLDNAKVALSKITDAISMSQTAYRSLYWDDGKATMVDGVKNTATGKQSTAREKSQLANYQAALNRLSSGTSALVGF